MPLCNQPLNILPGLNFWTSDEFAAVLVYEISRTHEMRLTNISRNITRKRLRKLKQQQRLSGRVRTICIAEFEAEFQ
jgi:hypothetical protein